MAETTILQCPICVQSKPYLISLLECDCIMCTDCAFNAINNNPPECPNCFEWYGITTGVNTTPVHPNNN